MLSETALKTKNIRTLNKCTFCIGVWLFLSISSRIHPLAHTLCWSFYPKTVEITCPK